MTGYTSHPERYRESDTIECDIKVQMLELVADLSIAVRLESLLFPRCAKII